MKTFLDPTITLQQVIGDQIYEALNGPVMEYIRQVDSLCPKDRKSQTPDAYQCPNRPIIRRIRYRWMQNYARGEIWSAAGEETETGFLYRRY